MNKKMFGKVIKNTNNRYVIYPNGTIENIVSGKFIKEQNHSKGYLQVVLYTNGKPIKYFIHRLLGEYYIDNPLNKQTINHKDGNKQNNNLNNLEWLTYSENNKHAYNNKLTTSNAKKICMFTKNGMTLEKVFDSTLQAEKWLKENVNKKARNGSLGQVANGKRKSAYGYKWEWLDD